MIRLNDEPRVDSPFRSTSGKILPFPFFSLRKGSESSFSRQRTRPYTVPNTMRDGLRRTRDSKSLEI